MKKSFVFLSIVMFIILLSSQKSFSQNVTKNDSDIKVVQATYFDVSAPLTEMKPIKGFILKEKYVVKNFFRETPKPVDNVKDPIAQRKDGNKGSATILHNFAGSDNTSGVAPPDTQGDVGPNHYFQAVNNVAQIWDKSGTSIWGPTNTSVFWDGFSGSWTGTNDGDPIVLYDQDADRWIVSQFAVNTGDGTQWELVAISTGSDPTGSYYRYAFQFTDMPDYPKLGVWADGYYLSANRFTVSGGNFNGTYVAALERDKMLIGNSGARMILKENNSSSDPYSLLPVDCDGTFPAVGTPCPFIYDTDDNTYWSSDRLKVWNFTADWTTPANSTFTQVASLTPTAFNSNFSAGIDQPGTTDNLDVLNDRMMFRAQYMPFTGYNSIVVSRTVNTGSNIAGIRWYELRQSGTTWSIYQEGTYAPGDGNSRWMPSIAQNSNGEIALGYSISGASTYPSIRVTGRYPGDALGQMTITETSIQTGTASQTGVTRWGDYSMMSIDPSDGDFWYTQEYTNGGWNWVTKIAEFRFPTQCTPPTTQATAFTSSGIGDNQMTVSWTRGNGNQVLVVAREGSAVAADPSSGTSYTANSVFGSGNEIGTGNFVVYNGTGTNVTVTGLNPGTVYYYAIYEYFTADNCYLTPGLAGNATTTGTAPCDPCYSWGTTQYETSTTRVVFNTIDNSSAKPTDGNGNAYSDYTNISTSVFLNTSYNLSTYVNTDGNYTVQTRAWIDWNQDCDFDDAGESYSTGSAQNQTNGLTNASPLSITVPATALTGTTVLRVSTRYNTAATSCLTNFDGEVEDYSIVVTSNTPVCTVSATPGCGTGSVTVSSSLSGTQIFYLRDNSGGAISDWTGNATSHEFTGLSDGTYKGQVENGGNMSVLSDGVTLTNETTPTAPSSVSASETSICSGSSTTLSYTGGTGTTFGWYTSSCGGTLVGTGDNLSVSPTTTTTYYGRWENTCGNSTCESVTVNVNAATSITTQPTSQSKCLGESVTFTVAASGSGTLTYQWKKGGTNISGATSASYSIASVAAGDAGDYTCDVTGTCGSVTSNAATLTISTATAITSQPSNQSATVGESVTFSVTAEGTNLTYQWKKDGTNITGATSASYTIASVTAGNAGSYSVAVTGDCGTITSDNAILSVLTSVEDLVEYGIKIYPNPTTGLLNIELPEKAGKIQIVITDVTGKIVYQDNNSGTNVKINLGVDSGIYLIKFIFNEKSIISKIIVE